MKTILRSSGTALCLLLLVMAAGAQTENVGTGASETATYGTTSQNFGPFPWSDLGITASANITPGVLNVQTGGSTSFTLPAGSVTPGEFFNPGSTVLNLGYTPNWTGSFSGAPPATGNLNSSFVYNLGPLGSGSYSILNVSVPIPGSSTGSLTSSLNALVVSPPVLTSQQVTTIPPVGFGIKAQVQVCFIVCATVASASVSFGVQAQTTQNVIAAPAVTYGDLVWESTTQKFSPSATFVPGSLGKIANTFTAPPASLGLTSGQTFYYNFLPVVQLDMPVSNDAQVAVPASITASYNIFGAGGSQTFPLGNLYSLNTGFEKFDFNPNFNGSEFYSIPLVYTAGACQPAGCAGATYETLGGGGSPVTLTNGGGTVPSGTGPGPCPDILLACDVNVIPPGSGITGGYGNFGNLGPLFPNPNDPCEPAGVALPAGATCQGTVTQTQTPEPSSLLLFGTGLLGLATAIRRKRLA